MAPTEEDSWPAGCPPEEWVQQVVERHKKKHGQPDVRDDTRHPHLAPGAPHHGHTQPPRTRSDMLKLVTFNILHAPPGGGNDWDPGDPNTPRWVQDVTKVIAWSDADLIGLQEGKEAESDLTDAFGGPDGDWRFECYDGPASSKTQNPVMLRKGRWKDITSAHVYGCPEGPSGLPPEVWISRVDATHVLTGQRMRVFNIHFPSHVDNDGVPYDLPRQDLYRQAMENLVLACRDTPDGVLLFVMGDTNVNYRNAKSRRIEWWPPKALSNVQMVCNWFYAKSIPSYGTHGETGVHSVYDHIYARRTPLVQWQRNGILKGLHSDHNAVRAVYHVTRHATAQDPSTGRPRRGGSNTSSQGHHDDRSHQQNLDNNAPAQYDLIGTANLNFGYSDAEHLRRIDERTNKPGAGVLCLQELTDHDSISRWTETQPNQPDSSPAGQSILVRNDLATPATGSVRASMITTPGIQARYFPWADVDLQWLAERIRVVCVHMPPVRFPQSLYDDYTATLHGLLDASPHPWIVGGDWNHRLDRDPAHLQGAYKARFFGQGIDGLAVHPDIAMYVGGDGGRKYLVDDIREPNPDGHVAVYLRIAPIDRHQRRDQPDNSQ